MKQLNILKNVSWNFRLHLNIREPLSFSKKHRYTLVHFTAYFQLFVQKQWVKISERFLIKRGIQEKSTFRSR